MPPTEVNQEHQYKRYDNFPVPKLENVYKAWKPVDHGHPLNDETLFYAPPSMERVRFKPETEASNGPQSRSIDAEVFQPRHCVQIYKKMNTFKNVAHCNLDKINQVLISMAKHVL